MAISNPGIFTQSVFSGGMVKQTDQKAAAAGFSQIFTTMLAKQMRESMVGQDAGPMGIGGGATGDIYGSFIDGAMGKALANSKSMSQLNKMVSRELGGARHGAAKSGLSTERQVVSSLGSASTRAASASMSQNYTGVTNATDSKGPLLLPPAAEPSASDLLPPPSEG
jgi:Rod binding domain-containing protein